MTTNDVWNVIHRLCCCRRSRNNRHEFDSNIRRDETKEKKENNSRMRHESSLVFLLWLDRYVLRFVCIDEKNMCVIGCKVVTAFMHHLTSCFVFDEEEEETKKAHTKCGIVNWRPWKIQRKFKTNKNSMFCVGLNSFEVQFIISLFKCGDSHTQFFSDEFSRCNKLIEWFVLMMDHVFVSVRFHLM